MDMVRELCRHQATCTTLENIGAVGHGVWGVKLGTLAMSPGGTV
jgi:hypothetical protein